MTLKKAERSCMNCLDCKVLRNPHNKRLAITCKKGKFSVRGVWDRETGRGTRAFTALLTISACQELDTMGELDREDYEALMDWINSERIKS